MLKYWTVCSPSTSLPGNGSSEWLSGSSTSIGVSTWREVQLLVVQECLKSRIRARQERARARAARRTRAIPWLGGPSTPILRWPLLLQILSGAETSLGEEKRGEQGRRSGKHGSEPNNPIRAPMGPKIAWQLSALAYVVSGRSNLVQSWLEALHKPPHRFFPERRRRKEMIILSYHMIDFGFGDPRN